MHQEALQHFLPGLGMAWSFQHLRRGRECSTHRLVQWIPKLEMRIKTATIKSYFVNLNYIYVNLL